MEETTNESPAYVGNSDFREELKLKLKYSGIYVMSTTEYDRAMQDIKDACSQNKYNLVHWDSSTGLQVQEEVEDDAGSFWESRLVPDTKNPSKAIKTVVKTLNDEDSALASYSVRTLYVFRFFDAYFKVMPQSLEFIDTIINNIGTLKSKNISFLFYGPDVQMPPHLVDDVFALEYPMPDQAVIQSKFWFIRDSIKRSNPDTVDPTPEFEQTVVRAALGQSAPMAESTFAHAAAVCDKKYTKQFIQIVKKQTMQRIKDGGLVQPINVGEHNSFEAAFGGYDWVRQLFVDDLAPFRDPDAYTQDKKVPKPDGCLIGSPAGFGKSLLPKAVAWEYDLPLLRVDASCIKDKHYGESEQKLRKILNIPRQVFGRGGCIIWFDEADKLFGGFSKTGDDSTSGTGQAILGQMLTWLQERKHDDKDHSYVICTFNNGDQLPDALIRPGRFSTRIWLNLPSAKDRKNIFTLHLNRMGRNVEDFDIDKVVKSSNKFSGAEIEGAVETMCKRVYSRNEKDEEATLLSVIKEIHPAAADANSEYVKQEEWANSRKFGSQSKSPLEIVKNNNPNHREIAVDKKNAVKDKIKDND